MRHHVGHRKLQRTTSHRLAMLKNMVTSLLEHEQITTTVPKAKEARRLAEKIITLGKQGGLHNVRLAERTVRNRVVLEKVFGELKDRYANRPGGYTRLLRAGFRKGDAADVAVLELMDRPAAAPEATEAPKTEAKAEAPKAEAKAEKPAKAAKAEKAPKAEKSETAEAPKKKTTKKKAE